MRLIIILAVALSGCGIAHMAQVQKAFAEQKAACEKQYPDPHQKPVTPRIQCLNNATTNVAEGPEIDLAQLWAAKRVLVAEQYDNGKISTAEYDVAMAQIRTDTISAAGQRQNSAEIAAAASSQASAAQSMAIQNAFRPRSTTCTTYGATTTCN